MMMIKTAPVLGPLVLSVTLFSCAEKWPPRINLNEAAAQSAPGSDGLFARIDTNRGEILVRLEYQKAPLTVCNFAALAAGTMDICAGKPFYDGLTFHRVIPNFMIQGGDPLGSGQGGPGYQFPDEIDPSLRHDGPGVLSMANAGPGTNGSQFFITLKDTPWLDGKHTVFGKVVEGMNALRAIGQTPTDGQDRPRDKVIINRITIVKNGAAAQAFGTGQADFDRLLTQAKTASAAASEKRREADLAQIAAKYPGLKTAPNGVLYLVQKEGTGPKPQPGSTVQVNYTGMFLSGQVFDASDAHGGPLEFKAGAGQVIPGWDASVMDMRTGEKRLVVIPPELAYGDRGAGGVIPPNSFLVFEMELTGIK